MKGIRGRTSFFEIIEKQYNDTRSADGERPMTEIDGSKDGDTTVTYDRGGWVFWMLLNEMGRDDCLMGLQSFVAKFSKKTDDYPVLQDFVAHMRPFAKNQESFDAFVNQWIFDKVVPQYKFEKVEKAADGESWKVKGTVRNAGTGKVQLEICACTNDRWLIHDPNPDYQSARTMVTLGAGESVPFEIVCPFNPEQVLVDPDFLILQLNRKLAVYKF
jgi:ABC-2 type transport system permease protein